MTIPELSTPIRIYWDLTPLPADPPDHEKIAADIIALKILNLDITATGRSVPASCYTVIRKCVDARIRVNLTISPSSLSGDAIGNLAQAEPTEILFEVGSLEELQTVTPLPKNVTGASFRLSDLNWHEIPDVVRFSSANGFKHLVFPMQRLYEGEAPLHIPAGGLAAISEALLSFSPEPGLRLTAHDPFVWRAIFPATPFPNGRCQAANTMLSIDRHGKVYPCPVMPVYLGDLKDITLKEIAKGEDKRALRSKLQNLPADCVECSSAADCKGGCRGRGERVSGSWDAVDPGCR